ncbi:cytochrome c oxidase assembly protein COX20, mitochondrial [Polyergus mexicanus]|uniref:cytochrome c oxidase assembly protein COX20, mitochondrial n=1 Tax=Polyergus mexicanus TaxID=615972 RepID=UPI0038B44D56
MDTDIIDENDQSKAVMLFGRDISKIPCFKRSMLYGIYGGFATGLVTFMITSRIKLSTNITLGSYMGISVVYFCFCRYDYVMHKYAMNDIKYILRRKSSKGEEVNEAFQEQQEKLVDA